MEHEIEEHREEGFADVFSDVPSNVETANQYGSFLIVIVTYI